MVEKTLARIERLDEAEIRRRARVDSANLEARERRERRLERAANDQKHVEAQAEWDETLQPWGKSAPMARADEDLIDYRKRLCRIGKKLIAPDSKLNDVHFSGLAPEWLDHTEPLLQAEVRSSINRADTVPAGTERMIVRKDELGRTVSREFVGADCFVKRMGRPGRRVTAFLDTRPLRTSY
jgi:hypothetical protein